MTNLDRVITKCSDLGVKFIGQREGLALRAYRCPAGVITIGFGFTMASAVFAAWAKIKWGRALRMGDEITEEEAYMLLPKVLDEEYGKAVAKKIKPTKQHLYDQPTSTSFNCGKGSLDWKWGKALAAGDIPRAAALLRRSGTTANGRPLVGLQRRRDDEAHLMETGEYRMLALSYINQPAGKADVREYQRMLAKLGYYKGDIDGIKASSDGAVRKFQKDNGLKIDGIVGPATRSTLIRALDGKLAGQASAGTGAAAGGGSVINDPSAIQPDQIDWGTILTYGLIAVGAIVVVYAGFQIWRNRGAIFGTGRVPV